MTVLVDSREKVPLLFPRSVSINDKARIIKTKRVALKKGDYALKGKRKSMVFERKASAYELANNMLDPKDHRRQIKAFDRLAQCERPILLLEGTPAGLLGRKREIGKLGSVAFDRLIGELTRRNIGIVFVGSCSSKRRRRYAGELVVRMLVAYNEA